MIPATKQIVPKEATASIFSNFFMSHYSIGSKGKEMASAGKWNLPGSDLNLPDFGISEKLGINKPVNMGGNYVVGAGGTYLNKGDAGSTFTPSVKGASTSKNTNTSTRPTDKSAAAINNGSKSLSGNKDDGSEAYKRSMEEKAKAELKSLNTSYDRTKSDLQSQLGYLGSQRERGMSALQNALSGFQTQVGKARTNAGDETERAINEAASTTQETVRSNRNTLRGLGILSSSAAGDILSRPTQAFDVERANLKRQFNSRLSELDDFLNQKSSEHTLAVQQLEDNFSNLVGKIQRDLRFNDRERADAIREAQAALQYNMQQITLQQQQAEQMYNQQLSGLSDAATLIQAQEYDPNANLENIEGAYIDAGEEQTGGDAQVYAPMSDEDYYQAQLQNQAPVSGYMASGLPQGNIRADTNRIRLSNISNPYIG